MPEIVEQTQAPVVDTEPVKAVEAEEEVDVIVEGPALTREFGEKILKKVIKEGGKRGVEIEGAADMGGLQFFCTMMGDSGEGDVDLLIESMKAMNAKSDPSEEERKGGAGKLGKMIFTCTDKKWSAVAYVPKDKAPLCSAKEWLAEVVLMVASAACVSDIKTFEGIDERSWAAICIEKNGEKDLFPIKMRDPAISNAYTFLKKRELFPEDDSEDEDECCFGDDDFDM
jgi:hypothetical protein